MEIAAAISRAALPDAHVVCGTVLRPYCIGHWLLMQRCGVSFVTDSPAHGLGDLLTGVLICADTYENFAGSLRRGGIERAMQQWQHRLSGGSFGAIRRRLKRILAMTNASNKSAVPTVEEIVGFNFHEQCDAFQNYIDQHGGGWVRVNDWSIPSTKVPVSDKGDRTIHSPPFMVLLDALVSEVGLSESEVLNMPLPMARWRWAIHGERKDRLVLQTDETAAIDAENRKLADEFARSGVALEEWIERQKN
jgi:hypothetical protein